MVQLTTGLINNPTVAGVRPTASLAVRLANDDTVTATVLIEGFYMSGAIKIMYVQEPLSIAAGNVATRSYYAQLDAVEFQFTTSSAAVEISVWGKDTTGNLVAAHRACPAELNTF